MKVWKAVTLLHALAVLAVLAAECDPAFGSDEVSSSGSASKFVGQVEADDVATQNAAGVNSSSPTNSTSLFTTSLLASANASAAVSVTQEDKQVSVVTTAPANSENVKQTLTSSTSSATSSVSTTILEATQPSDATTAVALDTTSTTTSLLPNWTSFPNGTEEQIISLLNNSDIVVKDLPTAVCVCLGLDVPTDYLNLASEVVSIVDKVLIQVVEKGSSLLSVDTFKTFISAVGAGSSVESLNEDAASTLEKLISEGKTCGTELQSIITKVTQAVADIKTADATSTKRMGALERPPEMLLSISLAVTQQRDRETLMQEDPVRNKQVAVHRQDHSRSYVELNASGEVPKTRCSLLFRVT
ncbi:hypothetical protein KRP22_009701 [Phytophthora ramorum]|nr:hypothetical protein KRP22_14646 [Phytophthora ramorum]